MTREQHEELMERFGSIICKFEDVLPYLEIFAEIEALCWKQLKMTFIVVLPDKTCEIYTMGLYDTERIANGLSLGQCIDILKRMI